MKFAIYYFNKKNHDIRGDNNMICKRNQILILTLMIMNYLLFGSADAEFYRYTDEYGRQFFVDDPGKIPSRYSQKIRIYKEEYDHLTVEERQKLQQKDKSIENDIAYVNALETKIDVSHNQIIVPVEVGYKGKKVKANMLLDTGASILVLNKSLADKLQIRSTKEAKAYVVGGKTIDAAYEEIDYVQVGPNKKEKVIAGIIEHKGQPIRYEGLLGMNVLRELHYQIDFNKQVIRWIPQAASELNHTF